ncbi:MAG TPA: 50S ribosomal protein L1 [Gemmataceae bacterium]|jgi:large subunit ribosomal protein L1|nr:50S ribosomal protein L1 [Gemmataceae bacterium]
MAKKPTDAPAEAAAPAAPAETPAAQETKKPKEPRAKEPKPKEPKPKEPRGKTAPPAEAAAPPGAAPPAAKTAPTAPLGEAPAKKKGKAPGIAPRRGKKLRNQLRNLKQKLAKDGPTPLKRAIGMLKQMKRSKFDETVEIHMSLGVDPSQNDQMVRGSVALPHGIGKSVRVLVFCQGENVARAKEAGADYAGSDEFIKKIQQEGWLDFDVALATQDMMGQVSRLGKVLGPRGLMPTPKAGTVITGDVAQGVREFKAGKVEYRADKGGNVHAGVGKLSFDENKLTDNITAFVDQVRAVKPSGVKGNYVKSITLSATMSPGIPVTV